MEHSWILIVAMIGHVLCVYADRLLLCTPGDQFSFSDMKENARMAKLFEAKSESDPLRSIVLGRAFHTGGDRNDTASRMGLRVQSPADVSCAGTIQHSWCGKYRQHRNVPWFVCSFFDLVIIKHAGGNQLENCLYTERRLLQRLLF